jgi:hypothetical protein
MYFKYVEGLQQEHRGSVLRALRKICGPKGQEVIGDWRKLYNEELNNFYSLQHIRVFRSWKIKSVGNVERMEEKRGTYRVLVGKPEGKRAP